ncbi:MULTISPECIES: hypothetical protein [Streptomyces]|uniref:hypothetical protein n=1 Tax=Streptomyces TaxID=1883 RepID=UPI002F910441
MTKSGHDHLKRQARVIARSTGRRFPDVLAELRHTPRPTTSSKALVLVCSGLVHPIDGGRCARPAGHLHRDGGWGYCSKDPHYPVQIWDGYAQARAIVETLEFELKLARMSPSQRAAYEADMEAEAETAHWEQMAEDAREPDDPYEDKYRFAEPDDEPTVEDGYGPEDEYGDPYDDDGDDDGDWDGDRW